MNITTYYNRYPGDIVCPVSMYMTLRDRYPRSFLLESSEYKQAKNGSSFLGFDPIVELTLSGVTLTIKEEGGKVTEHTLQKRSDAVPFLSEYLTQFNNTSVKVGATSENLQHTFVEPYAALHGYLSYEAITYFDSIEFAHACEEERSIPVLRYCLFRYVLQLNHATEELCICKNVVDKKEDQGTLVKEFDALYFRLVNGRMSPSFFSSVGEEESNFTDEAYGEVVERCKKHIQRGDVFQIVPSRRFSQKYEGDDFQVYRALRSINPSPYLFYFDCGDFRLFGSSPEALLVIDEGVASSYPIAGTRFRSGDEDEDQRAAQDLLNDEKENAEHVMLVDLARNDLSRFCTDVRVTSFRETQFYSHVIHLVSLVQGNLDIDAGPFELLQAVFPAGTLSGAPKYRAMELIDQMERGHRSYYAGGVGFIDFKGNVNHAIMIRTFLSKNETLYCQAGGGIVADSKREDEVQEVKNKLAALKRAVRIAGNLSDQEALFGGEDE